MDSTFAGKIGKYEIIKVLGRGGMGEVLLANDVDLGRRVAIKRPFKSALEDGLARFQVEAKAATLRHPNIPAVYEMGVQDGLPFIAMEFVEGEPLDKIIASNRQIELIDKLHIIEQVCLALGHAHSKSIIHRDIKPANVIVQPDGVAKIIDFGIAKIQDADSKGGLTQTQAVIGTLHYIAPERFKGGPIDGRVDLFSAGVMLFKLLTGEEPFTGGEATASYKIVNEAHSSLANYLHDYPPALDEIITKSLAKNPEDRYSTGEDFADALHEVIEDLKRSRVNELFLDAERLTTESRYTPALELLEEAVKLDPANTQVRKLRKLVREHQDRLRRAERLRECIARSDESLLAGNFEEALSHLKEAQNLDPSSADLKAKIQSIEDRKRRSEMSARALVDAEASRNRGDVTAALRIVTKALNEDPDNQKLLSLNTGLARQAEVEAQRARILKILEQGRRELSARNLPAVERLLAEADVLDPSNIETDTLRRELVRAKEQEQRRGILEEIQARVNEFLRSESYDQAADLLSRAIDKLPNETMLHRLKAEVDTEARNFANRRFVDDALTQARDLFASSPFEALDILQGALDHMPGEERLVSYERSLRQQLDAIKADKVHADILIKARELMDGRHYDKAIGVLESFRIEFGQYKDIEDLLTFAREEQASLERNATIERSATEGRSLIRDGRLDDAIRLLDQGYKETGDASLSRLLSEVREQQQAFARKLDLLEKRVTLLRERGEFAEAIQLLREQLAVTPGNPELQNLLTSSQAIEHYLSEGRAAFQDGRLDDAVRALEKGINETGDPSLSRLLAEIRDQQAAFQRKIESIEKRAALLRERGEYDEAIRVLKEQLAVTPGNPTLQDLMTAVKAEQEHRQVAGKAIASAKQAAQKKDFAGALESLQAVVRAYGDSAELAQATKDIQAERATYAQDVVNKSIEGARAALLKNDPPGALTALKAATAWMEFVDVKKQADWQRIGQSVKKALEQAGTAVAGGAAFDAQLNAIAGTQPKKFPVAIVAIAAVVVVAIIGLVVWKMQPPPGPTMGHITIAKAPAGALVSIDNGPPAPADASGMLSVQVQPGSHQIQVTKEGFDPFNDKIEVGKGETVKDEVSLTKSLPPGTPLGTLSAQGNMNEFKLSVDGKNMGMHHAGEQIKLEVGAHTVRYTAQQDESDYQENHVQVALNKNTQDTFNLKPPTIKPQTQAPQQQAKQPEPVQQPVQQVAPQAIAQPSGSLSASAGSIERGKSVQLSWQVSNASSVSISGVGNVAPSGSTTVYPTSTTRYQLTANGSSLLSEVTIDVYEPKQQAQVVAPQPVISAPQPSKPSGPDAAALAPALGAYKSVFAHATGKACKGTLTGAFGGKLSAWARWCDEAKGFDVAEQCGGVGGSPDSPTLSCAETLTIHLKDGGDSPTHAQRVFHFSKGGDGSWQVTGW